MIAAVEDPLAESVLRKLVAVVRPDLTIWQVMRKNGSGYVRSRARELNRAAQQVPVFILVDQDRPEPCAADLIRSWLGAPSAPNLLFRTAVFETESWIMADRDAFAAFLRVPATTLPENPDAILQPKELVVALARRSRGRDIRDDLVPARGSTAKVGPAFNPRLTGYVTSSWDPVRAAEASASLHRAIVRLGEAFR